MRIKLDNLDSQYTLQYIILFFLSAVLNYLMDCLSSIESKYPNCGIILLGDFNKLNVARLKSNFNLKQIVNFPTRGPNTLDLILTNLQDFYDVPEKRPPFGLSDHLSIEVKPKMRTLLPQPRSKVRSRDLRPSNRLALSLYLQEVDVPALISTGNSCSEKVSIFETIVNTGLDIILPVRSKTIHSNEPPWINPALKDLIRQRQRALAQGNLPLFRLLRNRVNRERKSCRGKYYEAKVAHLKECKPSMWWKEVKKLSGISSASRGPDDFTKSLQHIDGASNKQDLANIIIVSRGD